MVRSYHLLRISCGTRGVGRASFSHHPITYFLLLLILTILYTAEQRLRSEVDDRGYTASKLQSWDSNSPLSFINIPWVLGLTQGTRDTTLNMMGSLLSHSNWETESDS